MNNQLSIELEFAKKSIPIYCSRSKGRYFFNAEKKTFSPAPCKCYKCPECGKYKRIKLENAICNYIKNWSFLRMWTFTYRASIFRNKEDCYKKTSAIWKYFITYFRRCKKLSDQQKQTIYIKVLELHKSGLVHYHVLFAGYLPVNIIRAIWRKAINTITKSKGINGNVNISELKNNHKSAGRYIAKYVSKASTELDANLRLWSKSEKISIFEIKIPNKNIYNQSAKLLEIILKTKSITSQNCEFITEDGILKFLLINESGEIIYEKRLLKPKPKENKENIPNEDQKISYSPKIAQQARLLSTEKLKPLHHNNKIILSSIQY